MTEIITETDYSITYLFPTQWSSSAAITVWRFFSIWYELFRSHTQSVCETLSLFLSFGLVTLMEMTQFTLKILFDPVGWSPWSLIHISLELLFVLRITPVFIHLSILFWFIHIPVRTAGMCQDVSKYAFVYTCGGSSCDFSLSHS